MGVKVRIERTDGLVLMTSEELQAEMRKDQGEMVIRISAQAMGRPGAFCCIRCVEDGEAIDGAAPP